MQRIFISIMFISILLSPLQIAHAQNGSSECIVTKVGNPSVSPALPAECYTAPSGSPTGGSGDHPTAPPCPGDCRQALIDKFGVTMNNFTATQTQWIWEKMWEVSNTNFDEYVRGTVITGINGMSEQTGCRTVNMRNTNTTDPVLFKIVYTHELGHIIYWCTLDSEAHRTDHQNVFNKEGGCTGYGRQACYGTSPVTEDYAEMIAYYLNPGQIEQTASCSEPVIPFEGGENSKYPEHYKLARTILGPY